MSDFPNIINNSVVILDNLVTTTRAQFSGVIIEDGSGSTTVAEAGFYYGMTSNPTSAPSSTTADIDAGGNFNIIVTGLTERTTYYCNAYVKDVSDNIYYHGGVTAPPIGEIFILPQLPDIDNDGVVDISENSVTLKAIVHNLGESPLNLVEAGFFYSKEIKPSSVTPTFVIIVGAGVGSVSTPVTGLDAATPYYVNAYIKDSLDNYYYDGGLVAGDGMTFITLAPPPSRR